MKKIIFIFLMVLSILKIFSLSNNNENSLIKRKILILPFYNKNNIIDYDYLSDILMETLRAELIETNKYTFTNFSLTNYKIKELGYNREDLVNSEIAKKIALQLGADIVITGQYIILEDRIMILIHTIDILTGELIALTKIEGKTGVEIFNIINKASNDVTNKILDKLPMLERKEYEKIKEEKDTDKKNKFALIPRKKVGIGLISSGSTLLLAGGIIFAYDLAGYSNILRTNRNNYIESEDYYQDYYQSYYTFISLFASGISLMGTGVVLLTIGLPLLLYNKKTEKISFLIEANNNITLSINIKL